MFVLDPSRYQSVLPKKIVPNFNPSIVKKEFRLSSVGWDSVPNSKNKRQVCCHSKAVFFCVGVAVVIKIFWYGYRGWKIEAHKFVYGGCKQITMMWTINLRCLTVHSLRVLDLPLVTIWMTHSIQGIRAVGYTYLNLHHEFYLLLIVDIQTDTHL